MKPTKSILILLSLFLISNCGDKVREEIIVRYDNGSKKLLVKYRGEGVDEVVVEKILYTENGDTLRVEKPFEGMKMVREYYYNGPISSEKNYKDGERDGKWIRYYKDGQIKNEENYKGCCDKYGESFYDGKWTEYYENGRIEREVNYKDGERDGKWTWFHENGQIMTEENYKDGNRDGKMTSYYENGQIWMERNFKDGKDEGKWTFYNEDGSIIQVEEYKDGKLVK